MGYAESCSSAAPRFPCLYSKHDSLFEPCAVLRRYPSKRSNQLNRHPVWHLPSVRSSVLPYGSAWHLQCLCRSPWLRSGKPWTACHAAWFPWIFSCSWLLSRSSCTSFRSICTSYWSEAPFPVFSLLASANVSSLLSSRSITPNALPTYFLLL